MIHEWSANSFVKFLLINRAKFYQKISQNNSHHQVKNRCEWRSHGKPPDSIQFSSWNKELLNDKLKLFIMLCWKFCTHWWSLVPSTILRLKSCVLLLQLPFFTKTKEKTLWQAWEKSNLRTRVGQFLKKNTNDLNFLLFIAQKAEDRSLTRCDELEKNLRKAQKKSGSIVGDLAT